MPELPEVETMVRGLRPALVGPDARSADGPRPVLAPGVHGRGVRAPGRGARVSSGSTRRGKWVVIALGGDRGIIVIQPRMTGGFWLVPPDRPDHVRLTFHLDGPDATVWFCDTRRLGKIAWYPDPDAAEAAFATVARAGRPGDHAATSWPRGSRGPARGIKPTLMDQKVLAGIGNIYADEILFRARIHPERPASSLTGAEVDRLHAAIGDGPARGDRGGGVELRRRVSDGARARGRLPRRRTRCTAAAASPARRAAGRS